jgi:hypothetical protein
MAPDHFTVEDKTLWSGGSITPEAKVNFDQTGQHHIPDDTTVCNNGGEKLKTHKTKHVFLYREKTCVSTHTEGSTTAWQGATGITNRIRFNGEKYKPKQTGSQNTSTFGRQQKQIHAVLTTHAANYIRLGIIPRIKANLNTFCGQIPFL